LTLKRMRRFADTHNGFVRAHATFCEEGRVSATHVWSPGQRALLRFLEREGLLAVLPDPPAGAESPTDDLLFAVIAETVSPTVLAEAIAARLRLPLLEAGDAIDPEAATLLAAAVAARCGAIPLGLRGDMLEVATANPLDLDLVKTVEFASGRRVRVRVATPETVRRVLERLYGDAAVPPSGSATPSAPSAETPAPEPIVPVGTVAAARPARILLWLADATARERLAYSLHDAAPDWLVVTAQDADEACALAALTGPDVLLVDAAAAAGVLATGALATLPSLDPNAWPDLGDLVTQTRFLIDTAQRG
jgi:hypothetical protein